MEEKQKRMIEEALEQATNKYPVDVALDSIKEVYDGKLWIVGGFISSVAIPLLHGYSVSYHSDLDILLAENTDLEKIKLSKEWIRGKTVFGSLRFEKGYDQTDIFCLPDIQVIKDKGLDCSLNSYLKIVPLTIQRLAYDVEEKKVCDEVGLSSLETKTVMLNCEREYYSSSCKTPEEYIRHKAKKLGFTPIF